MRAAALTLLLAVSAAPVSANLAAVGRAQAQWASGSIAARESADSKKKADSVVSAAGMLLNQQMGQQGAAAMPILDRPPTARRRSGKKPNDPDLLKRQATENLVEEQTHMAVKRYLLLKSELTAKDIVPFTDTTRVQPSARSTRKQHMKAVATATATDPEKWTQCPVVDGCVSAQKMRNFLHNKFIPGRDNIATEWLPDNGHMFKATCSLTTLLSDMRSYLLTRPLDAVTAPVARMLYYGDLSGWPGGNGGDRSSYYPRVQLSAGQFWETDIKTLADKNQELDIVQPMVPQASQAASYVAPDGISAQQQLQQQLQRIQQPNFSQVPATQQPLPTTGVIQNGAVLPGQNIVAQPATQPVGTQMQTTWVTAGVAGLQGGLGGSQDPVIQAAGTLPRLIQPSSWSPLDGRSPLGTPVEVPTETVASGTNSFAVPDTASAAVPDNVSKQASKPLGIRLPWAGGFGRRKLLRA